MKKCELCGTTKWLCRIGPNVEAPTILCGMCAADSVEMGVVDENEIFDLELDNETADDR